MEKKAEEAKEGFSIESVIETTLFRSRWLLAPLYLGLVLALLMLLIKFTQKLFSIFPHILEYASTDLILSILSMVDILLVANLILIIMFSGYENFVSKIDSVSGHVDKPSWMGTVDYSGLKLKVIGSLVAISSIELLKAFIDLQIGHHMAKEDIGWMIGLHMTFVVSGLIFALTERFFHGMHHATEEPHRI